MLKNMNKTTKNNMITYLMVIVVYAVIQVLVTSGSLSSLFTGLLVPICTYIILAISLNLVVGFPWRTEPWTCRIHVYRSIYKCIFL